jgi:hypothetical protein
MATIWAACALRAEIVDRIAISVADRVVTTSDIHRDIRMVSFLNGTKPDFSLKTRREAADRLVDQALVERELEATHYRQPAADEIAPAIEKFRKDFYPDDQRYRAALAQYGLTEDDVKSALLWQRKLLMFVNERFRPGVQVTQQDIQEYFDKQFAPAQRAAHPGQTVSLADYRDQVEDELMERRVTDELDAWLLENKRRNPVTVHPEAFQ